MTTKRKEKTLARERMAKTGENYTAALAAVRQEHLVGVREIAQRAEHEGKPLSVEGFEDARQRMTAGLTRR